jgi:hypothetical protein
LNYIHHRRNQTSGGWFVKNFIKDAPLSLHELQQSIQNGDTSFVDKLTYFSQKVQGSDSY